MVHIIITYLFCVNLWQNSFFHDNHLFSKLVHMRNKKNDYKILDAVWVVDIDIPKIGKKWKKILDHSGSLY